MTFTCITCTDT